jgi:RimJ/RimL family protein N-acetyltransferase
MRYDAAVWPLFDLRITTPSLELRPIDPEMAFDLCSLATHGVHDPAFMPFDTPWTDEEPLTLQQNGLRFIWRLWAEWSPDNWNLAWGVFVDGQLVGNQAIEGRHFPMRRTVETGSWLGLAFQGRGIGKEMRAAILHFGFDGLGAQRAETAAYHDNEPSLGVTRSLGYEDDGTEIMVRRGRRDEHQRFKMERAKWAPTRRDDIEITGLTPGALALFGLDDDRRPPPAAPG